MLPCEEQIVIYGWSALFPLFHLQGNQRVYSLKITFTKYPNVAVCNRYPEVKQMYLYLDSN